ncbi:MAG: hypothetical protein AAB766_03320 [Patescibacteria group bacterium]
MCIKSGKSRIILAVIIAVALIAGGYYFWQFAQQRDNDPLTEDEIDLITYSSLKYSFKYPKEYNVSEDGKGKTYILTLTKNDKTKLEIFNATEYPGDRAAFGFEEELTPEEAAAYLKQVQEIRPKEYLKVGNFDVWLYYDQNDSVTKKELKSIFDSIQIKTDASLIYQNKKYGFEFSFDEGYENLWAVSGQKDNSGEALGSFYFTIKNAPNPDLFVIFVYDKSWWLKNIEVLSNLDAWKKGEERSLPNSFGIYLGASDQFAFAFWPDNQTCPDLTVAGPGPLCKLTNNTTDMVLESFKVLKK